MAQSSSSFGIVPPCSQACSGVQISAVAMNSHSASDKIPAVKKIRSRVRRLNWNFPGRISADLEKFDGDCDSQTREQCNGKFEAVMRMELQFRQQIGAGNAEK